MQRKCGYGSQRLGTIPGRAGPAPGTGRGVRSGAVNPGGFDMDIDFERLWRTVAAQFVGRTTSIHGPAHWRRVERNGLLLAERTGADMEVVRLFALFHDSRRETDG